ncbi:MAG: hypothetical protein P8X57_13930 [Cyclobacteriaceae bacterium]
MKKFIFALLFLASCASNESPEYLDTDSWRFDDNGCDGYRAALISSHPELLQELKGKSEDDIIGWLGKPDKNELYKRNQKFYIYIIDPAEDCENSDSETQRYLQIRFSATNRAQEVMIYE